MADIQIAPYTFKRLNVHSIYIQRAEYTFTRHLADIQQAFGRHSNSSLHIHKAEGLELWNEDPMFLAVREEFWISKMNSKHKGMNRNKGS